MPMTPTDHDPAELKSYLLRCRMCRRSVETTVTEMIRRGDDDWPRCCQEEMLLITRDANSPVATKSQ